MNIENVEIILEPSDQSRLMSLCGPCDDNIKQLEHRLGIKITYHNNIFKLSGFSLFVNLAANTLRNLYIDTAPINGNIPDILPENIHLAIKENHALQKTSKEILEYSKFINITTKRGLVRPRTINQTKYLLNILKHDITFGTGPAGTGKTYLAVAVAVNELNHKKVRHILLTRPVVEAGEKLGFLPGDFTQKVDPYLRPLYDALFEMIGFEQVEKLLKRNIIEIAPLAYMRGRTLNDSFIILDEAQNTTIEQMKMFLTRLGFNSKAVITGDITQVDLPQSARSGLYNAIQVLAEVKNISLNFFNSEDVVRHPLVARIVEAYDAWAKKICK